ncbi:MAG: hypothetical protein AAFY82_00130 [Pseudomonadota bacterium]
MALLADSLYRFADGGLVGGVRRGIYHYASPDALTAIEANGYFDSVAHEFTEGKGDVLLVSAATGGTAAGRAYVVTRTGTDITLAAFTFA